jgi:molybdopterin molybdotransferase
MIRVAEALETILGSVARLPVEECRLLQAHGRVLGEGVVAGEDIPLFDNSSMDGYALRSADVAMASEATPVQLRVSGVVAAGGNRAAAVGADSTVRIMTGAPIPTGADAVIEQEAVGVRNGSIVLSGPVLPGKNIRRRGEDVRKGEVVLEAGTELHAAQLGVLASLGCESVKVFRKPRVAFLTTGNELVELGRRLDAGQIRNSNAYTLQAMVVESGGNASDLGIARDTVDDLTESLRRGLDADVLVTSGGVSVGVHDHVIEAMTRVGVQIKFWKVNMKPGMPVVFGVSGHPNNERTTLVFGLPGNPVSTMVTFLQFVRPTLYAMTGRTGFPPFRVFATLKQEIVKKDSKRHFVRGILRNESGTFVVETTGSQSSGVLSSMARANCLIVIPEETATVPVGTEVEVQLL